MPPRSRTNKQSNPCTTDDALMHSDMTFSCMYLLVLVDSTNQLSYDHGQGWYNVNTVVNTCAQSLTELPFSNRRLARCGLRLRCFSEVHYENQNIIFNSWISVQIFESLENLTIVRCLRKIQII